MIDHYVMVRWKPDASPSAIAAVIASAQDMMGIEGVQKVQYRKNLGLAKPEYGRGINHVVIITMRDLETLERFRPHPIHKKHAEGFNPLAAEVTIIDIDTSAPA